MDALLPTELRRHIQIVKFCTAFATGVGVIPYHGHLEVDGPVYSKGLELVTSHVGQIFRSATLNTAAEIQAIYCGTWTRVNDYHLVAYAVLSAKTTIAVGKNISSITESSTRTYKVTLSKTMSNANYVALVSGEVGGAGSEIIGVYSKTTTTFNYDFTNHNGILVAPAQVHIAVFGELATPEEYIWKHTA